jgi:hypothetical protein
VAEAVVVGLEAVEVEQREDVRSADLLDHRCEVLHQPAAVSEAREKVGPGFLVPCGGKAPVRPQQQQAAGGGAGDHAVEEWIVEPRAAETEGGVGDLHDQTGQRYEQQRLGGG